jgi:hypothetical protein
MSNDDRNKPSELPPEVVQEMYDEVIGYGQPPRSTRFKKGQSGNLKGRPPKKSANRKPTSIFSQIAALATAIVRRPIKVREGGKEREIDSVEGILLQLQRKGLTGDVPASRLLLEYVERHEMAEQERLAEQAAKEAGERTLVRKHWEEKLRESAQTLDRAERLGLPVPVVYPHPDDIVFDADDRMHIKGPICVESAAYCAELAARQEFWLAHIAYDHWLRKRWQAAHPACASNRWMLVSELSLWTDRALLPERMQLSEGDIISRIAADRAVAGREQYRRLRVAGRERGLPVPPREMKVPMAVPREVVELGIERKMSLDAILAGFSECLIEFYAAPAPHSVLCHCRV